MKPYIADGEALLEEADDVFALATEANSNGDDYSMAITLLTVTLFFTGLSVTISASRYRTATLLIGAGFLVTGTLFSGFSSVGVRPGSFMRR